jgi:hemolysin activation/secretion protein/opacity protein-like surface antigen
MAKKAIDLVISTSVNGERVSAAALALALGWLGAGTAAAQSVNPETVAPPPRIRPVPTPAPSIPVFGEEIKTPPNGEKVVGVIRRVRIQGAFPELASESSELASKIEGRRVTLAEVYDFARALQEAYAKKYPLARVVVPSEPVANGDVRVTIIDGYIEKIDLAKAPERERQLALSRLEPLVGQRHLGKAEFERRLLLLGDIAGLNGSGAVAKGSSPSAGVLVVQASDKLIATSTAVDNLLPSNLGTWRFSSQATVNNALGWGEQITGNFSSSRDFNQIGDGRAQFLYYGGTVSLPIGTDGLVVTGNYANVRQMPQNSPGVFSTDIERAASRFDRFSIRAAYPLFLTIQHQIRVMAGYDYIENRQNVTPFPLGVVLPGPGPVFDSYRDRYSAFRLQGEWAWAFPWEWGGNANTLVFYGNGLGGRTAFDGPIAGSALSRPGSGPTFNKVKLEERIVQPLPGGFQANLTAKVQENFGAPLPLTEQLSIDGLDGLSGFASGTVNVDRGGVVRGELARPFNFQFLNINTNLSPYVFDAWGGGVRDWPFISENKGVRATSFGAGLRANTGITSIPMAEYMAVEFARDVSNIPYRSKNYRVNFIFSNFFSLDSSYAALAPSPSNLAPRPLTPWKGAYFGLNAGFAFDSSPGLSTIGVPLGQDATGLSHGVASAVAGSGYLPTFASGGIAGAQFGYNHRLDNIVVGVEADIQGLGARDLRGAGGVPAVVTDPADPTSLDVVNSFILTQKSVNWLGTLRPRVGYLITPTIMAYVTGGLAYGGVGASSTLMQTWGGNLFAPILQSSGAAGHYSQTAVGWSAGAGVEWMFSPILSLKGEYLYYDLGRARFSSLASNRLAGLTTTAALFTTQTQFDGHVARLGLNYHFGRSAETNSNEGLFAADRTMLARADSLWAGPYLGLNVGYAWDVSPNVSVGATPGVAGFDAATGGGYNAAAATAATNKSNVNTSGYIGGGQIGYNWQLNKYVLGAEVDFQGAGVNGLPKFQNGDFPITSAPVGDYVVASVTSQKTLDWLGTVRGRLGYAANPALLAYATGGLAYGGVTARTTVFENWGNVLGGGLASFLQSSGADGAFSGTLVGWTVGGGLEWMLANNVSFKAEALHYDLNRETFRSGALVTNIFAGLGGVAAPNIAFISSSAHFSGHIVRAGLNYHFRGFGEPVGVGVAKY